MPRTEIPRLQTPYIVTHSECGKFCEDACFYLGIRDDLYCCEIYDNFLDNSDNGEFIRLPQCINKQPA